MFRRKGRLILTQLVLIIAGSMFLLVMSLTSSIFFTIDNDISRRNFDLRIGFDEAQRIDRTLKVAATIEGIKQAEMWFSRPVSLLLEGQRVREAGVGAEVIGIPKDSNLFNPQILEGRWLEPTDQRAIVIAKELAEDNGINIGDTITLDIGELGDSDWQVVGITTIIVRDAFSTDPIYAPLEELFEATKKHNQAQRLVIQSESSALADIDRLNLVLKTLFTDRKIEVNVFTSSTTQEDLGNTLGQLQIVTSMLFGLAIIVASVGGIGLMGSLSISVVERTREIGVMRAIGAKSRMIMSMFVMEGILQSLLSWTIAVPLSFFIAQPIAKILGQTMLEVDLDFKYSVEAVLYWLIIVIVIAIIASILPARAATRISVQESLMYG
ncbi:MAG: FtsX-like permease family protein [Chloroflexota bacterium]